LISRDVAFGLSSPSSPPGFDPAVHSTSPHAGKRRMDARVKPAHDEEQKGASPGMAREDME
jgi:hypothetical protein